MAGIYIKLSSLDGPSLPYQKLLFTDCLYGANRNGQLYKYDSDFESISMHEDWITDVVIHEDSIYTSSFDKSVLLNNKLLGYHTDKVIQMQYESYLVSMSSDGILATWKDRVEWNKTDISPLSFDLSNKELLLSTIEGKVFCLDLNTAKSRVLFKSLDMVQYIHRKDHELFVISGSNVLLYDLRNMDNCVVNKDYESRITCHHHLNSKNYYGLHNGSVMQSDIELFNLKSPITSICTSPSSVYSSCLNSSDLFIYNKSLKVIPGVEGIVSSTFSYEKTKINYKTVNNNHKQWNMITNETKTYKQDSDIPKDCNYLASWASVLTICGNMYLHFEESKLHNSEIYLEDLTKEQLELVKKSNEIDRVSIGPWLLLSFFRKVVELSKAISIDVKSPSAVKIKTSAKNSPISPLSSPFGDSPFLNKRPSLKSVILNEDNRSQSVPLMKPLSIWPFEVHPIQFSNFFCHFGQLSLKDFQSIPCNSITLDQFPVWSKSLFILEKIPNCIVSKLSVYALPYQNRLPKLSDKPKVVAHRYMKLYKIIKYLKETLKIAQDLEIIINGKVVPESSTLCTLYFLYAKDIATESFKSVEIPQNYGSYFKEDVILFYRPRQF